MQLHQRYWNGLEVDRGLHDEWLAEINNLRCFVVDSTCEGHMDPSGAGGSQYARIWLSLRGDYYTVLARIYCDNKDRLKGMLSRHFIHPETHWDLYHEQNGHPSHIRNYTPHIYPDLGIGVMEFLNELSVQQPFPDHISLLLDHAISRQTTDMPDSTVAWFNDTVSCLKRFDTELAEELNI